MSDSKELLKEFADRIHETDVQVAIRGVTKETMDELSDGKGDDDDEQ